MAPPVVATLLRGWFATCRVRVRGLERMDAVLRENGAAIAVFWHYSFLYIFYHLRAYSAAVMVSSSRDGEYIARLAERFHHLPVRGSSNQRGFRALREMVEQMRRGSSAGIVADGSQGPARGLAQPAGVDVVRPLLERDHAAPPFGQGADQAHRDHGLARPAAQAGEHHALHCFLLHEPFPVQAEPRLPINF